MPEAQTPLKRGVKKGGYNPGGFRSGTDVRRANMKNRELHQWKEDYSHLCREHVPSAFKFLGETLADPDKPDDIRMLCVDRVLSYGLGKPVERHLLAKMDNPEGEAVGDITMLSNEQLMKIAAGSLATIEGEVVPEAIKDVPKTRRRRLKPA